MKHLTAYTLILLLLTAFVASCDKILSVSVDQKLPPSFTFDGSRFAECCNYLQYFAVMEETTEDTHPMFNTDPSINHKILWKIEHEIALKAKFRILSLPKTRSGQLRSECHRFNSSLRTFEPHPMPLSNESNSLRQQLR